MARQATALAARRRPLQRRSRATVGFVLEAAAQVFSEAGYAGATTNHIAARAGVSIGTLYQYFPNKDALLVALAEEHLHQAVDGLGEIAARLRAEAPPLADLVRTLVDATVALNRQDPSLHRLLWDEAPRTPELRAVLARLEDAMAAELAAHLRRLGAGGPDPDLAALITVRAVEELVHRVVLAPPPDRTPDTCATELTRLCLRYLSAPAD